MISLLLLFALAASAGLLMGTKTTLGQQIPLLAGIAVVGAILAANQTGYSLLSKWLALAAIVLGAVVLAGSYITNSRMGSIPKAKPGQHRQ